MRPRRVCAAITGLLFLAAAPLIATGFDAGRAASDENHFHVPVIRQFARQWPWFDVSDYAVAMTPGYHILLATVEHFLTGDVRLLRAVGAVFGLGLAGILAFAIGRRVPPRDAVALCLPVVCSPYVFASTAWALPDDAGWLAVLTAMLLALDRRNWSRLWLAACPLLLAIVAVRQIHVWTLAPLCVAAWLGRHSDAALLPTLASEDHDRLRARLSRVFFVLLGDLPAVLLLVWFFKLWHGPVPPTFQVAAPPSGDYPGHPRVNGFNPTTPAVILCLAGLFGLFFAGFFSLRRKDWLWSALGAAGGLILAMLPRTDFDPAAGRSLGFWRLVRHVPTFAGRSPLIWVLGMLGGAVLAVWFAGLGRRDRWIFAAAWAGFVAAQACSALAWERYLDPFVLLMTALMAARTPASATMLRRWAWVGPALLAAGLALGTVLSLR